ncbi:MAG: hypothetical protein RIR17_1919, partial [Planctomycetota bacterium]
AATADRAVGEATRDEHGSKMTLSKNVPVKAGDTVVVEVPEFNSTATAAR